MSGGEWLYFSFNQNCQCFTVGTTKGFLVYNSMPCEERFQVLFNKGIGIVEILWDSNIVGLVGGGPDPAFPPQKLILWDDQTGSSMAEIQCPSAISGVKIQLDKIILCTVDRIFIFDTRNMSLIHKFDIFPNIQGACSVSATQTETINIAIPSAEKGHIALQSFNPARNIDFKVCNNGSVRCLCLNSVGTLLATVSDIGTIIRIYDSSNNSTGTKPLHEFRRGTDHVDIYSMCFSPNSSYLVVNSDSSRGSIHVFCIKTKSFNKKSSTSYITLGYYEEIGSAAEIAGPTAYSKVSFISETEFVLISKTKEYHHYRILESNTGITITRCGFKPID